MLKGPNQPTSYQVVGSATAEPPAAFLTNVHWFRGVAIVAVVATHVLFEFDWRPEVLWEFKLSLSLMQNGTVLFVFVAGLLFQHLAHRFSYQILPFGCNSIDQACFEYRNGRHKS